LGHPVYDEAISATWCIKHKTIVNK